MKYNQIILESLQKVALKKVRIKVDPINVSVSADLSRCNGYEGYVLAENAVEMTVLVVIPGPEGKMTVMNVPVQYLELLLHNLNNIRMNDLKQFVVNSLDAADGDPIFQQIETCESIDDIEAFLKDRGLTEEDINKLYKYYIANE